MLQQFSLSEASAEINVQPRLPREIRGLSLAKSRLPAAARTKLASDIRDGRATVIAPTASQAAALCRVPAASVRVRGAHKSSAGLVKAWENATAGERQAFLRARLDALLAE